MPQSSRFWHPSGMSSKWVMPAATARQGAFLKTAEAWVAPLSAPLGALGIAGAHQTCGQTPSAARHRAERVARPTYDGLEDIAALWEACGLTELQTAVLELSLEFPSVEDLWLPFLGGSTEFSAFARDLNRETGGAVAKRLREMIEAEYGTSEFMLTARAWAVAGRAAT